MKMSSLCTTFAFCSSFFLVACGGGGSGKGGSSLTSSQIVSTVQARVRSADNVLTLDCSVGGCVSARLELDGTLRELLATELGEAYPKGDFRVIAERNGVRIASGTGTGTTTTSTPSAPPEPGSTPDPATTTGSGGVTTDTFEYEEYAGWGEYNVFSTSIDNIHEEIIAVTAGAATGSTPISGSATWRGIAVAGELASGTAYHGDATLTVDFAASNVDAAFTNMRNKSGAARGSITFDDVPLTSDGFDGGGFDHSIEGTFYGPGHAEVGGVFHSGRGPEKVVGSFGATRQ